MGVEVDAAGIEPAARPLQQCIDATTVGGTLELPPGIYAIDAPVLLTRAITIKTQGVKKDDTRRCISGDAFCATLRASADLLTPKGVLNIVGVSDVTLDHVAVDGNRSQRLRSRAADQCRSMTGPEWNHYGQNIRANHVERFLFHRSSSVNALCGTALEMHHSKHSRVVDSALLDNGQHDAGGLWADGMTAGWADTLLVTKSLFRNNTDIDIVFSGKNTRVAENRIEHDGKRGTRAFGGLMLDNWATEAGTDLSGTVVENNVIDCRESECNYALQVGPTAWYANEHWIHGFVVRKNTIRGGIIAINVGGARDLLFEKNEVHWKATGVEICGGEGARFNASEKWTKNLRVEGQAGPDTKREIVKCAGP